MALGWQIKAFLANVIYKSGAVADNAAVSNSRPVRLFGSNLAICYPCRMKVNEILAMLKADGWYLATTRGSHRQFKHPAKSGRVTVPVNQTMI